LAVFDSASAATASRQVQSDAALKPLTYQTLVSFFKEAKFKATEIQKRCTMFFEGEWKDANVYSYCVVMIENSDEDLQVTFYLTDAHELNWVSEFLDGPFFSRAEKIALFGVLNSGRDVAQRPIGRFLVDYHACHPRHAEIVVFSFTPKGRPGSERR
jgi:hypothetical protein